MESSTMIRHLAAALLLLTLGGCQQPSDVELTQDEYETDLEVRSVLVPDTNVVLTSVDSSAVLPADQLQFRAFFLLNHVTHDAGDVRGSFSYSRVYAADSAIRFMGRTVGFRGMDLGTVRVNGVPMVKLPHIVRVKRQGQPDSVVFGGFEYLQDLTGLYRPDQPYVWSALTPEMGSISQAIRSPDDLVVHSPAGGSVISRERDLVLRWTGARGQLSVVISSFDPLTKRTRPLLELRSRANSGRALIPGKLIRELPRQHPYYVFTFVLANRVDTVELQQFAGKVMVQAASVYNSYVELR
jgi:hypothetical protein